MFSKFSQIAVILDKTTKNNRKDDEFEDVAKKGEMYGSMDFGCGIGALHDPIYGRDGKLCTGE
jgi:hypothetical protein